MDETSDSLVEKFRIMTVVSLAMNHHYSTLCNLRNIGSLPCHETFYAASIEEQARQNH